MDACCALTHYPELELSQKESNRDKMSRISEAKQAKEEDFGETWMGKTRSFLWNLTEYPEKNLFARVKNKCRFGFKLNLNWSIPQPEISIKINILFSGMVFPIIGDGFSVHGNFCVARPSIF